MMISSPHFLLCYNPSIAMTCHVLNCSLLEYCIGIFLAEIIKSFMYVLYLLESQTLHIKNRPLLDNLSDFQRLPCRIPAQVQTLLLFQPLKNRALQVRVTIKSSSEQRVRFYSLERSSPLLDIGHGT